MKKILLIVSVALLVCAVLVVSVSAAEWKAESRALIIDDFEGDVGSEFGQLEYRFYVPVATVQDFDGEAIAYTDLYVLIYFDGLDYRWVLYGTLNGRSGPVDTTEAQEWTLDDGEVTIVSDDAGANLDDAITLFNTYVANVLTPIESEPPSLIGSLTAIFSGVSTWLISGVVLLIGIFWTGSALTPLGYLAVAGLSISVILLIFYLISRFLKFRG